MTDVQPSQIRLGPILLAPGITRPQCIFYIAVASLLLCLSNFMAIIQPYVFTEQLHIPTQAQGRLAGNLSAVQQVAVLLFVTLFGALADRYGRRIFLIFAVFGMTAAILLYPLATAVIHLFVLRFLFGMASTCNTAGGPAMRMDLTDNNSRGRFLSVSLVAQAIFTTVVVSWMGTRLPAFLASRGVAGDDVGRYTFWIIGLLGAAGLAMAYFGLRRDRPANAAPASIGHQFRAVGYSLREVLQHAKVNPRFRILLIASAVLRADTTVLTTFMSLWVINGGRAQGLTSTEALQAFSTIAVIMSTTDLVFGVVAGFVADRVNRLRMLVWSVAATALAFSTTIFVESVTGVTIILVVIAINLAEAFQLAASHALIGQETPAQLRGSAYGMIAWIGTISVIIVSVICGHLVDAVGYKAPFLLMAGLGGLFAVFAAFRLRASRPANGLSPAVE